MQPDFSKIKVNNEIELCEINDLECKQLIERELHKNRISFFIRWGKSPLFSRSKINCILCVNDNAREATEDIVQQICDDYGYSVKYRLRKSNAARL